MGLGNKAIILLVPPSLALAGFRLVAVPEPHVDLGTAFRDAINDERALRGLAPIHLSSVLSAIAQERALEIGDAEELDFDPASGEEALAAAKEHGYQAWLAQELIAIDEDEACDIVAKWTRRFSTSDAYLRHEAQDIGVGAGILGGQPLYVLEIAAPASRDPLHDRLPGIAPREWLTTRLADAFNRERLKSGLEAVARDSSLDAEAQQLAESLMNSSQLTSGERAALGGVTFLYFRGLGKWRGGDPAAPVDLWFRSAERTVVSSRRLAAVGAGLCSRGADETLEAVWVLAFRFQ
jgi:uncharacterized protein YkwD